MALNYSIEVCLDANMHSWRQVAQADNRDLALDIARLVAGLNAGKVVEVNGVKGDGTWDTVHSFFVDDVYVNNDNAHQTTTEENYV